MKIPYIVLTLLFLVLLSPLKNANAALVDNGRSTYVIVLPDDAIPAEQTAAEELRTYVEQMSGAKLPIVVENAYNGRGKMLAVGFNAKLPAALQAQKFGAFGQEEILIAANGETMLLAGGRPRGTLYAVQEFLHRLGVRWYTPEATKVPKLSTIKLPEKDYRFKPPMTSRTPLVGNNPTPEWDMHNRLNSRRLWTPMPEKYGGGYGQGPDMHTFERLLPVPLLEAHPEWMAVVKGKRELPVGHTWGLDLSNEEVRRVLIERTLAWARKNPDKKGVWIGQNDGSNYCTCEKCTAFYKAHGGKPSSIVVSMLNDLADALKKEMPDRIAKTLAYSWSLEAPTNITARENTMIMFTAPGSFSVPIATDPERDILRKAIADWRGVAKNIEVYLYSAPWDNYWFVEPATYSAAQNIQWAQRSGINSIYTHLSGWGGDMYGSESVHLRGWLFARLSWDPTQDIQTLIEDFAHGYFGPAGDSVLQAIKLVHTDILDKQGKPRKYNDSTAAPNNINPATMRAVNRLYQKTYDAMDDPEYKKRLSMDWIPYLWSDFWLGYTGAGSYDAATQTWSVPLKDGELLSSYGKLLKQFMIDNKVNVLKERRTLNPALLSLEKMGVPWPAVRLSGENVEAVVVPGIGGKITDFRDTRTDFSPLKPYWGMLITEYPVYGSWRDNANNMAVTGYIPAGEDRGDGTVDLIANAGAIRVNKQVSIKDEALHVDLQGLHRGDMGPRQTGPISVTSAFMLDLQDKAFGDHPTVYVENRDGTWSKRIMGTETTFWYITGSIDVTDAAGRIVIASEKRPEGLLLTFDPDQVTSLDFESDTYAAWPGDQGRMMWLSPTATLQEVQPGKMVNLSLQLKILPDAAKALKVMSQP